MMSASGPSVANVNTDSVSSDQLRKEERANMNFYERVTNMSVPKLLRFMRLGNVVLSAFCIFAGFYGLFSIITLDITSAIISFYVMLLSCILLLFECRISTFERSIRRNFGFLFTYKGRAVYILFMGFLCFGMDTTIGFVAGGLMLANAVVNGIVLCQHPEFSKDNLNMNSDPTTGYTTGAQEAANFMKQNPSLAASATQFAFNSTTSTGTKPTVQV